MSMPTARTTGRPEGARPPGGRLAQRASGGRSKQHGFTLVELMVALALLALMSATLAGSLALAGRGSRS